ncbi:hypothetical protein KL86APRO_30154 [uncultured Alphaproteobacteria bacterium]|uniref:Uncharacterized protein n=1 Tax=uncultured Alphaproteobacteria bacterium TaxID=91750 RepID=A0A212KLS2_9PROT|nr:hypothetical protein KL86APRO_30154 [uncultured Alphaproteobacteria bacterium]
MAEKHRTVVIGCARFADLLEKEEQHAAMLVALEAAFEMAWEDTREVRFDDSIVMGKGYDFFGWENLRQEIHTGHGSWAVWPNSDFRGPNWSVYGGPDGSLWFEKFDTERAAKECAAKAIERLGSAHPIVAIRAAIAQAKGGANG